MQHAFNPYHKWLAIPAEEQPPTLYRLLGVAPFETDPDVIHAAADARMGFLRTFQNGPNAAVAERLLNEISRARVCLADAKRRAAYDCVLKAAKPADAEASEAEGPAVRPEATTAAGPAVSDGMFGNYRVLESIYASKLGEVYRAVHVPSQTLVSLKMLPVDAARNPESLRRFRREQDITCKLDHPNLIAGHEAGVHQGVPYLVTEYVVGANLAMLIGQYGPLGVEQAVDYTVQAARGLMQLHLHGVYHRNIKPHVLWVDMRGQVKIGNLFLAKLGEIASLSAEEDDLTQMGQMMGTPEYLAPEQAVDASSVDQRADVYSLGCTLHFMLTGRPPYGGKSLMDKLTAHTMKPVPSLRAARADVPEYVDRAFQRMLAKDREQRFAFMGDVVDALEPHKPSPSLLARLLAWCIPRGRNEA